MTSADPSIIQSAIEVDQRGSTIRGTAYRPAASRRCPAVLLLHGFTGMRIEAGFMFVRLARALAKRGVTAITFDCLNSGESDGSFDHMLVTEELDDTISMTHWTQGQPFVDRTRLGVIGFSLGGLLAACASAKVDCFKAMALLAPTTVSNLMRHANPANDQPASTDPGAHTNASQFAPPSTPIEIGPFFLHPDFFNDIRQLNPVADVIAHPRPTLVVQGSADKAVPPAVSQAYIDAMTRVGMACEVERIEGAGHTFARPAYMTTMIDRTAAFMANHLSA